MLIVPALLLLRLRISKMLKTNFIILLKRGIIVSTILFVIVMILPSTYMSKGAGHSFGMIVSKHTETKSQAKPISNISNLVLSVRNMCQSINKSQISNPATLLYSKRLNLIYCPVSLAFDTEFKQALLKLEDKKLMLKLRYKLSDHQAIHSEAQKLNLKQSLRFSPESLNSGVHQSLIIVRDPWDRLATAYRRGLGTAKYISICHEYMNPSSKVLTFDGFLQCLLRNSKDSSSLNKLESSLSPTHSVCSVCRVAYNLIVKFEYLKTDLAVLLSTKSSDSYRKFQEIIEQATRNFTLNKSSRDTAYLSSISRASIDGIQRLYALDFKLFNYPLL